MTILVKPTRWLMVLAASASLPVSTLPDAGRPRTPVRPPPEDCAPAVSARDPLAPLLFLLGAWEAEGTGPYGPFWSKTDVTRRGRWLLSTGRAVDPEGRFEFLSTWVFGYEADGTLVCHVFDTGGSFRFSGTVEREADGTNVLRFSWKGGDAWKRFEIRIAQGD